MTQTQYNYLKRNGFFIVDSDDKSGFWFRKEYEHPVINNLAIEVDPFTMNLSVWCEEAEEHGLKYHSAIILHERKFTRIALTSVEAWLTV